MSVSSAVDAIRGYAARVPPGTVLTGLVGAGIGPSLSPPLHETEASQLGLALVYARFDIEDWNVPASAVGRLAFAAREAGYHGLNITHPCKQVVVEHLDELSPEAKALGAVNTVVFRDGRAIGHNTDWSGFARALRTGLPGVPLDSVVLLGAGGAGAAVARALLTVGAGSVRIFDLDTGRADALARSLAARFGADHTSAGGDLAAAVAAADGLVHATPTGMAAHPGLPLPAGMLRADLWVAEVVYRPLETELVHAARVCGARVLDGGRMAVFQAAEAFALLTGVAPDTDRMLRHFGVLTAPTQQEKRPADAHD